MIGDRHVKSLGRVVGDERKTFPNLPSQRAISTSFHCVLFYRVLSMGENRVLFTGSKMFFNNALGRRHRDIITN